MFGISGLFSSSKLVKQAKTSDKPLQSDAVMIGDYIGTLGDEGIASTTYGLEPRTVNPGIVRVDVLPDFISYLKKGEEIFRHGIIGKCDGKFPVTNPVKDSIYYREDNNKYYISKTSFSGTVATPDEDKFEELSLEKIVKNGLVRGVNITGAVKGNGVADGNGNVTINTTVNYNDITGKPVALPNPHEITISLNGNTTVYKGDAAKTVTITAAAIGAQPAGNYSVVGHNHTSDDISGLPTVLPNPNNLVIKLNGSSAVTYSGSKPAEINITAASIGAQPAGNYSVVGHNHDSSYAKLTHNHTISQIGTLTGYSKASTTSAVTTTDTILTAIGKLERALDDKQVAGSYASSSHNHDSVYQPKGSYALSSHNHDNTYSKLGHDHSWESITGKPGLFNPAAHTQASSTINTMTGYKKAESVSAIIATDSLNTALGKLERALDTKQPAGNYASASHNHDNVYAGINHSHAWSSITNKPSTFTPEFHYQASNTINYLTGYSKPTQYSVLNTSDSLNTALGKLERGLDLKQPVGNYADYNHRHDNLYQPIGNYASSNHNHDSAYQPKGNYAYSNHSHSASDITMSGYSKPYYYEAISYNDTILTAIGKLEKGLDNKQAAGNYADANHTHYGYLSTSGGTISGSLTVTGQILSNQDVVAYSDIRMKTNLEKIGSALDKVSSINGYTYNMQGVSYSGERQAGVIAQELKEVLPEAVVTDENGYYAVRYTNIIPLLIEALKEEKSNREKLEERLAKIERMLDIK